MCVEVYFVNTKLMMGIYSLKHKSYCKLCSFTGFCIVNANVFIIRFSNTVGYNSDEICFNVKVPNRPKVNYECPTTGFKINTSASSYRSFEDIPYPVCST